MATSDPHMGGKQEQIFEDFKSQKQATEGAKFKVHKWFLATIDPLLFIFHITLIYLAVLAADTVVLAFISWTLGSIASQNSFAALLLEGVKILSTLGTAIAYALHLIYTLYQEGKHVVKVIREDSSEKEKIV